MAEYIEREAALWAVMRAGCLANTIQLLKDIDAVDAEPVKHGRWENYPSHAFRRCSICKVEWEKPRFNIRANYCPNCGTKMDLEV